MKDNIPILFDNQPKITKDDIARLSRSISGWNRLCEVLVLDTISNDDLKRLIVMEKMRGTKARPRVLRKLVGRLVSRTREALLEKVLS